MKDEFTNSVKAQARKVRDGAGRLACALEKGFQKIRLTKVTTTSSLDLSAVPSYVAYKAALIREKLLLQHVCLVLVGLLAVLYVTSRVEVVRLTESLRTKEYILAPGVSDFIPVAPRSVPDSYVQHAVSDFIATLGNTNPTNIDERYAQLASIMSPALQVQFRAEATQWATKAKSENIAEMLTVLEKHIEADGEGRYKAMVKARTDTFVGTEAIGFRSEVIELGMRLVPPDVGRRWYLEITSLTRQSADAFSTAKGLGGKSHGK